MICIFFDPKLDQNTVSISVQIDIVEMRFSYKEKLNHLNI